MTMYILYNLSPPEEVTGGVWYNANQGYDTALVHSLCQVLLKRTSDLVGGLIFEDKPLLNETVLSKGQGQ